jgi:serine protease Do
LNSAIARTVANRMRWKAPFVLVVGLVVTLAVAGFLFVRADEDGEDAVADEPRPAVTDGADGYTSVQDDTGRLTVEVPEDWSDVDGRPLADRTTGGQIPNVQAAPSLAGFRADVGTSGVSYSLIDRSQDVDATLDFLVQTVGFDTICTDAGRTDYADGQFVGRLQRMENCGNVGTSAVFVVATPATSEAEVTVEINYQLAADEPAATGERILATFRLDS